MRKINFEELNRQIDENRSKVERTLLKGQTRERAIRKRPRDPDEIKILDRLCIKRWKKAESEGKVKYFTDRKWFYDFD
jgi:hypothetical protein